MIFCERLLWDFFVFQQNFILRKNQLGQLKMIMPINCRLSNLY